MQSPAPAGSGPASAIALSPVERSAFAHLFNLADPERTGIVTGDAAVTFFAKSNLPPAVLGQIWAIADSANNGFLTPPSFSLALRLIGHAQRGEPVTEALSKRPGPPPSFEGITLPLSAQLTGSGAPAVQPPHMSGVIEIKPEDRARYTRIFASAGPQGGLIDGEKAKEIFVKSKLPFDKLGAIWNLADTQARGSLDLTDFIIGMHFIQNTMNGTLNSIPAALPPGLYEQAKGGGAAASRLGGFSGAPLAPQITGGSASGAIPRQFTGQPLPASASRTFSPAPPSAASGFQSPQVTGAAGHWDVTPEEKLRSDRFFDGLDVEKKGELEGSTVVPFFMQSKLTESVLAHVWDLSDITQTGTLNKDEFAVAMHLINQQLAGKELPQQLAPSLIPPSMRSLSLPQAVNPQQSDTQKDLFSLMDDDPPPPAVSAKSAFIAPTPAAPTVSSATSGPFDDDFFGGSSAPAPQQPASAALSPALTGGSFGGTPARSGAGDQGIEFGNKSLQLQSTQKAIDDLQAKRSGLETAVTTNAASLAEIETRLATVRSQHEIESKLVKDLETRRNAQSEELRKLREDVIREESALSALKAERDELEQAVMHDREDVRDMKKRMGAIQVETQALKETLEKLRKDARQQKGLVVISKKQLGTAEAERDKVQADIAAAERGEGLEAETAGDATRDAAASPVLATEAALSPATSVRSTNPFDRFGTASSRPESPAVATSHPGSAGAATGAVAAGAGLAAGAALGGVVASASADKPDDSDPFSVPKASHEQDSTAAAAAPSSAGFDDAFGVPTSNTGAAAAQPLGDFDDNFGDDFGASGAAGSSADAALGTSVAATATAFDDAFGDDFDGATISKAAAAPSDPHADAFGSSFAPVPAVKTPDGAAPEPAPEHAPQSDEEDRQYGQTGQQRDSDNNDDDDSSDDDEGPEDVEGYRQPSPGGAARDPVVHVAATDATPAAESSVTERFPDISNNDDDEGPFAGSGATAPSEATATMPGGFGALGDSADEKTTAADPSAGSAPDDASAVGAGETASTASIAPVSRQETGAADFTLQGQDAAHDDAAAPDAAAGGLAAAHDSSATSLTPSTEDDDVPLGQILSNRTAAASSAPQASSASQASLSPSSSIKTRRAPPPAPVRQSSAFNVAPSSSAAAPAGASASNPFGTDNFAPAPTATATTTTTTAASQGTVPPFAAASNNTIATSNFDDFDSAFEDLGQAEIAPSTGAGSGAGTGGVSAGALTGFDDAFDTDFDFVPSFGGGSNGSEAAPAIGAASTSTSGGGNGGASTSGPAAPTASSINAGFEDFDSAFDPISGAAASSAKAPEGGSQTNSGSAFSFEDAFAPAALSSSAAAPAPAPTTTSTTSTYAPPGPPPPALPDRKATSQSVSALPDDAGPVKQLCDMGFERPKVIEALEKSNYRTEKALERLLAEA
ncbi:hypothetical protein ACQY0O_004692 [Thecaphora frezii]